MRRQILASLIALVAVVSLVSAPAMSRKRRWPRSLLRPRRPGPCRELRTASRISRACTRTPPRFRSRGPRTWARRNSTRMKPIRRPPQAAAAGGGRGGRGGAARPAAGADPEGNGLAVHYDTSQFGLGGPTVKRAASLRTSIITGPEGRVPAVLPEAAKAARRPPRVPAGAPVGQRAKPSARRALHHLGI